MKKVGVLLLTFLLLLSLTACGKKEEPVVDANDPAVAEVGGVKIKKSEAEPLYDALVKQTVLMYQQQNRSIPDITSPEFITEAKMQTINGMAEQLALEQGLAPLGLSLTDAELADIRATSQSEYDEIIANFMQLHDMSEKEAQENADLAGYTIDMLEFSYRGTKVYDKLQEHYTANMTVTEEELFAEYDALIESQKQDYAANKSQYIADVLSNYIVAVRPEGFRTVKNLIIRMPEELGNEVGGLEQQLDYVKAEVEKTEMTLESDELTEEQRTERQQHLEEGNALVVTLSVELENKMNEALAQIQQQSEEVLALCKAPGADFDALMQEYSAEVPTAKELLDGYPVHEGAVGYVPTFTEGAMALEKIGDISDLVPSSYGYHILKYETDVVPGVVPLEELQGELESALLESKKAAAMNDAVTQIFSEVDIKTYLENF